MIVVTLSWQLGIEGERIGDLLGERLGLPVVNRQIVRAIMRGLRLRAAAGVTERTLATGHAEAGGGLSEWFGVTELRAVPGQAEQAHRTTESVLHEAGRQSCVVVGRGGFAALADHPAARHVRLIAPAQWRIERVAAERAVRARRGAPPGGRRRPDAPRLHRPPLREAARRPVELPPDDHRQPLHGRGAGRGDRRRPAGGHGIGRT